MVPSLRSWHGCHFVDSNKVVRKWGNLQCHNYLFMVYSDYTVSTGRVISEYCVGKDVKGSYCDPI
jgi:hypothetical protein